MLVCNKCIAWIPAVTRCCHKNETSHVFAKCLKVSKPKHGSPRVSNEHMDFAVVVKDIKHRKFTKYLMLSQKTLKKFLKVS